MTMAAPTAAAGEAGSYPSRPVRVVVPFAAGGVDVPMRLIAQKLSLQTGKQFYVENVGGGGSSIGTAQVARAAPDGYTILFTASAFVMFPACTASFHTVPSKTLPL
jgi:tripartite-type tricarboxylate transporter receptor subunit TctC